MPAERLTMRKIREVLRLKFDCELSNRQITQLLAEKKLFVWTVDFYASSMIDCLELLGRGGLVRIGIAPYNTKDELEKVIDALKQI
jgi:selenocysteine lyase/cysteine desulfurase